MASPDVPPPEQLEAQGILIGAIDIDVEDIFDPAKPGESAAPYRWANQLHLKTRADAVRSQLLFSESEAYSSQKLAETERLLRGRRYLFDAWIEPTCYHPDENTVDLQVRVRDVWSLNPGFNFNRKGGANQAGLEQQDEDFLGRGELVSVSWGRIDRDSLLFRYEDPQLLGSWWGGYFSYSDNTDGSFGDVNVGRPFYSLDTRWSAGTRIAAGDRVDSRYQRERGAGHVHRERAALRGVRRTLGRVARRMGAALDLDDLGGGSIAGLRVVGELLIVVRLPGIDPAEQGCVSEVEPECMSAGIRCKCCRREELAEFEGELLPRRTENESSGGWIFDGRRGDDCGCAIDIPRHVLRRQGVDQEQGESGDKAGSPKQK